MINMLILTSRINQNSVNKHNYKHIKILFKHLIHQTHKSDQSIFQPKRYHQKLIMTIPSSKSYLRNVPIHYPQLMIP
ncbi:hypothetical protein R3W88_029710 [Solanum pinnatisectum]|uniref:Uncharacterized protein n=1 Tax=Solanum pinnatisectum TaxID=50273 RepID=A0AAV9K8E5_9SOLN|nr:hypothetical protein R3W88_029710 [Solanum pinnatisectum]